MLTSLVLADILILFCFPLIFGVALIWFADFLKRRRDFDFLCGLNEIINKKDYKKETDQKFDE